MDQKEKNTNRGDKIMRATKYHIKNFGRGFIEGLGSLFDFSFEKRLPQSRGFKSDYLEIRNDWNNISNDLKKAITSFEEKEEKQIQLHLFDDSEEQDEKGVSV